MTAPLYKYLKHEIILQKEIEFYGLVILILTPLIRPVGHLLPQGEKDYPRFI